MLTKSKLKTLMYNLGLSYTNSLLAFIVLMILARMLGADEYSLVAIGIAAGGFIAPLVDLGSAKTFVRDAVRLDGVVAVEDIVASSYSKRLTAFLMVIVIVFIASFIFFNDVVTSITVAMISLWAGSIGLYPTSWFDFKHKTFHQNLCVSFERLVTIVLIVSFFYIDFEVNKILFFSVALVCTRILSIAVQVNLWIRISDVVKMRFKLSLPSLNSSGINIIITLSLISNAMLTYGNQLIFSRTGDPVEISAYSLAFQLVGLVFLFQSQALRLVNRVISEACLKIEFRGLLKKFISHVAFLVLVSILLASIVYIASLYLPLILDDGRFSKIGVVMPILSVWIVIVGAGQVVTQYLMEFKQEVFYLYVCIFGGLVSLFLGMYYIPGNGAEYIAYILLFTHSSAILINALRLLNVSLRVSASRGDESG